MTLRRSLLIAALPLALLSACGKGASGHFEDARKAFAAEDFATARSELIAALEKEPADPAMRELQVRTLLRLGDGEGALTALARLKRNHPPAPVIIARYEAEAALLVGAADDAINLLGDDNSPDAWRIRAAARLANGDAAGAREAFAKGLAAGEEPTLLAAYARHAMQADDRALATQLWQRLRAVRPDGLDTLLIGGMLASAAGDRAGAMAAYKDAARRYPHRYEPLFAQAEQLELQDKLPAAGKLAEQAAALAPNAKDVEELQLRLLKVSGQWEKLRALLQAQEGSLDPTSARGLAYAEALLNLGHPEQARITFQRALLLVPGNRYARLMLGQAQMAAGDAAGAWATLRPLTDGLLVQPFEIEVAEQAARKAGAPEADSLRQSRPAGHGGGFAWRLGGCGNPLSQPADRRGRCRNPEAAGLRAGQTWAQRRGDRVCRQGAGRRSFRSRAPAPGRPAQVAGQNRCRLCAQAVGGGCRRCAWQPRIRSRCQNGRSRRRLIGDGPGVRPGGPDRSWISCGSCDGGQGPDRQDPGP
jgi:tetratricopeptide (TPR) repeat protein